MNTQQKHDQTSVQEGTARLSPSRRNFIGATALTIGGLVTGRGATLAAARAAEAASADDQPAPGATTLSAGQTQVEALARYAARAKFEDLSAESRKLLPVRTLPSAP